MNWVSFCFQFLVEQNDAFQKEKLQEDYNDSYPWRKHYRCSWWLLINFVVLDQQFQTPCQCTPVVTPSWGGCQFAQLPMAMKITISFSFHLPHGHVKKLCFLEKLCALFWGDWQIRIQMPNSVSNYLHLTMFYPCATFYQMCLWSSTAVKHVFILVDMWDVDVLCLISIYSDGPF